MPDAKTYTYNQASWVATASYVSTSGTKRYSYGYDGVGNRSTEVLGGVTTTFTFQRRWLADPDDGRHHHDDVHAGCQWQPRLKATARPRRRTATTPSTG